jgi:predicted helicase
MFRDGQKTPNIDNELLIRLSAVFQVEYRIDAVSLFAYTFGILAGTDYTSRFTSELETPGPRIPITRDYQLFTQMVEFGKKLLWLQTFGERFEGKNRQTLKVSSEIRWKRKPTRLPEDLQDFSYVESEGCIYIADGALIGVPEHVWKFEVSGMQIIKKWLGYRTAKGTGRAAQSSSVLDRVRPTEWESAWSDELREIVHVLVETEKMRKIGTGILEEITSGALIKSEDLPEPPEELRNPPPTNSFGGLFDSQ